MLKNKNSGKPFFNSLKSKIITIILVISGFTTITGLLLLYSFDMPKQMEELKSNSRISLMTLAQNISIPLYSYDIQQISKVIENATTETFITRATVLSPTGDTITFHEDRNFLNENSFITLHQDIKYKDNIIGTLYLVISKEKISTRSRDYLVTSIIIFLMTIVISFILATKLQVLISSPIIKLTQITRNITSSSNYNVTIESETTDETGVLYNEFNNMILKIKEREEELFNARSFLSDVLNSMPSALITINPDLKIISINKSAGKLATLGSDELIGCPLSVAFPLFQEQYLHISKILKKGKSEVINKIEKNINGARCYYDIGFYPLSNSNGLVIRIDEVTKQANFENIVMQTEKIMSVGGLAAGMAHEINNPLGVMIQTAQNIDRRISTDLKANIKAAEEIGIPMEKISKYMEKRQIPEFLEDIKSDGKRAAEIVRNMLKFSHKSDSTKYKTSIVSTLENAISLAGNDFNLKKKYDFKDVEIVREFEKDIPDIYASETELEQVFLNILKNGVQAMSTSQYKSQFIIRVLSGKDLVRIEFEDNGPGIDSDTRKHIFEPFYTTKPVGEGTGLGLSVSYMIIVNNHNGKFNLESRLGKGTKFIIELPIKEVQ